MKYFIFRDLFSVIFFIFLRFDRNTKGGNRQDKEFNTTTFNVKIFFFSWIEKKAFIHLFWSFKKSLKLFGLGTRTYAFFTNPILFLYLAKIPTLFLGVKDYVLRIIPMLAGLGSLYVFYLLSKKILNKSIAIIALLLFIFSESLIYY